MELTHECWVLVASFLRFDERRTLMELNSAVADSPVRRRFFEDSVLRMPLREREIEKLLSIMKMERYVKRVVVKQAWHLFYIRNFPELEEIFVNRKKKMEGGSLATSCEIPYTCRKKLRVDTQHLPLGALMRICTDTTEEIDLRVSKLQGLPRALPGVKTLRIRSSWEQTFDWSDKVPNLRVLRLERTGFHRRLMDPLKHLEVLELVQCTSPSLEALMPIAPQLRRLELFDVSIQVSHPAKDAMNAFVSSLVKIEELSIVGPSAFSYSDPKLISMLTSLKKLDLRHQGLVDLTPLSTLTELKELHLLEPKLNLDWSPISSLKKLRSFWMSEGIFCTKSKNFANAIHSLPQLKALCYPWRLTAQYPLHHLRSLVLSAFPGEWKYRKLEVGCWPNLRELELKGKVDLQSVVASFPNLTKLLPNKLKYCPDFRPIASLIKLRELSLPSRELDYDEYDMYIYDDLKNPPEDPTNDGYYGFEYIAEMTELESFSAVSVPLKDLGVFKKLTRLRYLDIRSTHVEDISILAQLPMLLVVKVSGIRDLSCLRGHPTLRKLCVSGADQSSIMSGKFYDLPSLVKLSPTNIEEEPSPLVVYSGYDYL